MRRRLPSPPTSWIWLLGLFSIAGFVETVFWGQMSAFTPIFLPHLGIPQASVAAWTGAIAAVSGALGLPLLPFWGALADRYARQPIIVRSFAVHMLAGALCILAGNVWVFVLGRAVMSFALGNSGLMMTTLAERAPADRQGFAFSVMNAAPPIGAFLGPLLGGPIVDSHGFRALLAIDVALLLAVVLALSVGYRDAYRGKATGSLVGMALESVQMVLRSPRLRALFPALFVVFAGWMLALTYIPLAVAALYSGKSPGTAVGIVLGAGGLAAFVCSPVMGALADRVGHWRTLFAGAGVEVALWPLPALAHDLVAFALTWALISGVASGVFALSFAVLSSSVAAAARGRIMSFSYVPVNLGFAIGPAIGGIVTRGSIFAVFPVAAILTALGVGALAFASRQAVVEAAIPAG